MWTVADQLIQGLHRYWAKAEALQTMLKLMQQTHAFVTEAVTEIAADALADMLPPVIKLHCMRMATPVVRDTAAAATAVASEQAAVQP
jgi:hypothetical protein